MWFCHNTVVLHHNTHRLSETQPCPITPGTIRAFVLRVHAWWLSVFVVVVGFSPAQAWAGERLNAARGEVTASESSLSFSDNDGSEDREGESVELFLDEDGKTPRFLLYPYARGRRGYIVRAPESGPEAAGTKELGFHIQAEGAYLYEDVWRGSAVVRAAQSRLFIQGSYDLMLEGATPSLEGDLEFSGRVQDRLHFVGFEVGGQFAPSPVVTIRVAPVLTVMFDDGGSDVDEPLVVPWMGWSLGLDVFPVRPLVLRARGAIHQTFGVTMTQLRATAGVSINRVELYVGYDQRWLGDVPLGGPTAGVAVRF